MMKNFVKNFLIPCFIFELSFNLHDLLMASFCLQIEKKVYNVELVSNRKLTQGLFSSTEMPFSTSSQFTEQCLLNVFNLDFQIIV